MLYCQLKPAYMGKFFLLKKKLKSNVEQVCFTPAYRNFEIFDRAEYIS